MKCKVVLQRTHRIGQIIREVDVKDGEWYFVVRRDTDNEIDDRIIYCRRGEDSLKASCDKFGRRCSTLRLYSEWDLLLYGNTWMVQITNPQPDL